MPQLFARGLLAGALVFCMGVSAHGQKRYGPGVTDTDSMKIIQGRPYTDKNQLVSRHLVSEGTYDKIKDHVVAKQPKS